MDIGPEYVIMIRPKAMVRAKLEKAGFLPNISTIKPILIGLLLPLLEFSIIRIF
ncbi:MAG: hypothetical protein NKF70_06925 [Methanobacterium sp. ERen5]|nr:MAG: hypothetical protein NKF70_06925 [Methanobacterium sp. ERen5]